MYDDCKKCVFVSSVVFMTFLVAFILTYIEHELSCKIGLESEVMMFVTFPNLVNAKDMLDRACCCDNFSRIDTTEVYETLQKHTIVREYIKFLLYGGWRKGYMGDCGDGDFIYCYPNLSEHLENLIKK
jgi:hypothetical protein